MKKLIPFVVCFLVFSLSAISDGAVIVGPYDTARSGTGNSQGASGSRSFIILGHAYRVRQVGTITRVKFYIAEDYTGTVPGSSSFYVRVWRKDGATYDLVGTSENLGPSLAKGFNTLTLSSPITGVQEGDFVGYQTNLVQSGATFPLFARTGIANVSTYYAAGVVNSNDYDWESQTESAGSVMPVEVYMSAPRFVIIGDSIAAGHNPHYSFVEGTNTTNISASIGYQLSQFLGSATYQNMGIGSQTTTQISARFASDVTALTPAIAVIEGGVNDVALGSVTKATFISKWTLMLNACVAANIKPVVLLILPWTNGTDAQMITRDSWNAALAKLCSSSYPTATVVDAGPYVGKIRAAGPAGNFWDIRDAYNDDGVHFTAAGMGQIARALMAKIWGGRPLIGN